MKTVKAWALDNGYGEGHIEYNFPGGGPIIYPTRHDAMCARHNHGRKQRLIRVEIRELRPKKKGKR